MRRRLPRPAGRRHRGPRHGARDDAAGLPRAARLHGLQAVQGARGCSQRCAII